MPSEAVYDKSGLGNDWLSHMMILYTVMSMYNYYVVIFMILHICLALLLGLGSRVYFCADKGKAKVDQP